MLKRRRTQKKKQTLEDKKQLTLHLVEEKITAFDFWSKIKIPIPKTTPEVAEDEIFDPILNKSRKRKPWEVGFEYGPEEDSSSETDNLGPYYPNANAEEEEKKDEEEYTPFPTSTRVYHFHPIAFVEQMRRMDTVYRKGDKGALVLELNFRLAGFGGMLPTEEFTELTEKGVKQFQTDYMKITPTGEVDSTTLNAIDKFGTKYDINFEQAKCKCSTCDGFGKGLYSEQKQISSIKEKSRKYEYPGIHRSLFWVLKTIQFYLEDSYSNKKIKFGKISSGYRCHKDNSLHNRTSTNHMGKSLDLQFYGLKNTISSESNCDIVRDLLKSKTGAQLRWSNKNKFSLEPSTKDRKGREFIATTWVHIDVRQYDLKYLKDEFFIKQESEIKNKLI